MKSLTLRFPNLGAAVSVTVQSWNCEETTPTMVADALKALGAHVQHLSVAEVEEMCRQAVLHKGRKMVPNRRKHER